MDRTCLGCLADVEDGMPFCDGCRPRIEAIDPLLIDRLRDTYARRYSGRPRAMALWLEAMQAARKAAVAAFPATYSTPSTH